MLSRLFHVIGRALSIIWRALRTTLALIGLGVVIWFIALGIILSQHGDSFEELFAGVQTEPTEIAEDSVLVLRIEGRLVDHLDQQDQLIQALSEITDDTSSSGDTPAQSLIVALDRAATDDRIQGAVLELSYFAGGYPALLDEVADALLRFRAQGKQVLAYGDRLNQSAYFLAAHADRVVIDPMGSVIFAGYGAHRLFFADTIERLRLTTHAFVAGNYKSAPEQFTHTAMSENAKQAAQRWSGHLWAGWKQRVGAQMDLSPDDLQNYADHPDQQMLRAGGDSAIAALQNGLVHATVALHGTSNQALVELFDEQFGSPEGAEGDTMADTDTSAEGDTMADSDTSTESDTMADTDVSTEGDMIADSDMGTESEVMTESDMSAESDEACACKRQISWNRYFRATGGFAGKEKAKDDAEADVESVAVLFARGTVSGTDEGGAFDAWRVADQVRSLNERDEPPAVILLRLDTPGGSVYASEILRRALVHSEVPVLVSIGGLGASGGYYIATGADRILAAKGSITGSIGVFAVLFTAEGATNWLGANYDGTGTSDMSGTGTPFTALHPRIGAVFTSSVENTYQNFKQLVADSRNLSLDDTESLASGQVWTGGEAIERGLLDGLGSFGGAVTEAAGMVGLDEGQYRLEIVEPEQELLDEILRLLPLLNGQSLLKSSLGRLLPYLEHPDPQHLYMECLDCELSFGATGLSAEALGKLPLPFAL